MNKFIELYRFTESPPNQKVLISVDSIFDVTPQSNIGCIIRIIVPGQSKLDVFHSSNDYDDVKTKLCSP